MNIYEVVDKYELAQYILNENIPNTGSKTKWFSI
jgi:hypothetical protein